MVAETITPSPGVDPVNGAARRHLRVIQASLQCHTISVPFFFTRSSLMFAMAVYSYE